MESKKRKLNEIVSVDKILEDAEQNNEIEILNPVTLTKLLLSFEKKINKNQTMRMKHPDQPESFLDSEIDLHKEINNLYAVSASPELYPVVVESGSVPSILGMIAHDNTDISIAAIGLLLELTDPDTVLESDDAEVLIDAFLDNQALELIVQNLSRLDDNQDTDAQGVHDSLEIIENLVEIRPTLAEIVCEKTHILRFLLNRLNGKTFDDNKLYCSEILSILLQTGSLNLKRLHNIAPESSEQIDGVELLLQAIFPYRKRDPKSSEEKEFLQNLFLCLCTALMDPENQIRFREKEGFELMEKCLKENKIAAGSAVRVISYAILNNRENCLQLLEANGLKYLFPMLMGRGIPSGIEKAGKREIEESVISIVSQLCLQLHNARELNASSRILTKLVENHLEKTERCIELFGKYSRILSTTESDLDELIRLLSNRVAKGDEDAEIELRLLDTDEARYLKRLDGGLHTLQQLAIIITFVCVSINQDHGAIRRIYSKLDDIVQISFAEIQNILRELAASIEIEEDHDDGEVKNDNSFDSNEQERRKEQRKLLIEWSACLAVLESEYEDN